MESALEEPKAERKKKLMLVCMYRDRPCLWNVKDTCYKEHQRKITAWREIGNAVCCTPEKAKEMINNLRSIYVRERNKTRKKRTGSSADEVYTTKWWLYGEMRFLDDVLILRRSKCSVSRLRRYCKE